MRPTRLATDSNGAKVLRVKGEEAGGWGRWLAVGASLAVSAGIVYAQATEKPAQPTAACCSQAAEAAPPASPAPPAAPPAPQIADAAEVAALAANVAAPSHDSGFVLPAGIAAENGLQVKTIWAARAISVLYPEIDKIFGYRQDPLQWHPNGLAIDVMIPNHASPEGIALGDQIAGYALANAKRWGVLHVIWRQRIYPGVGAPSWTANYGSETANHYDHVHIATDGGGYPTGRETYFIDSMRATPQD